MDAVSEPMHKLAMYIERSRSLELPQFALDRAKSHFLDSLAAIVSGSALPAGKAGATWLDLVYPLTDGPFSRCCQAAARTRMPRH